MEQSACGLSITLPVSFETAVQQISVAYEGADKQSVVAAMAPLVALGTVGDNPEHEVARKPTTCAPALASLETAGAK